ncbi:bifunctional diguanylate cyclase/phosphodiesterase [Photobacterium damselae]|uniref:bifunctional diguanylate cyclase/phosphodiesterase n=1 Tax=Photobacterium damselae TaxID=38293 RepID=UPI002543F349|nr:GGDEF domain-containing protein [Photobacterium damselae]WIH21721.1 GGDEF domain-containing protein [Photobacterium damselae]
MSPEKKDFNFNYQPVYANNHIRSYEALLRLNDKNINIESFIQSIDNKPQFDLDVIRAVLFDIQDLNDTFTISINISILSLESDYFIKESLNLLKDRNIILEITEHEKANNLDLIAYNIQLIKSETGVKFALDDFGRGYSNTESLMCLPVDIIKVDRSLVTNITDSYISYAVLKTKIGKILNILEKTVIVEGIETQTQLDLINLIGDCCIQGFYYSTPLERDVAFCHESKSIEFEPEHHVDFMQKLDKLIYDLTLNKNKYIDHDSFNNIFLHKESTDILNNAQSMITRLKEPTLLLLSSLIKDCESFIIIRDTKGTAIYNNENHINYMRKDFVGIPVSEIYKQYPDYPYCIELDNKLLCSNSNFLVSNESVCVDHNIECFQTFRQKIQYFDQTFIICTVYRDNNTLTMRRDALTGLYSREILSTPYANNYNRLIFIDLNGFKAINDKYGHGIGDLSLKQVSELLLENLRQDDLIIRYGGDEFVVLTMMCDEELISRRLNEINQLIVDTFSQQGLTLSFSFGISEVCESAQSAIVEADASMYKHKESLKSKS